MHTSHLRNACPVRKVASASLASSFFPPRNRSDQFLLFSFFNFNFRFCIPGKSQEWGTNGGTAQSESEAGGTCVLPGPGVKVQCVIQTQGTHLVWWYLSKLRYRHDDDEGYEDEAVVMITTAIIMTQMHTHRENNAQCSDGRWWWWWWW